jgi:hypothetical protein
MVESNGKIYSIAIVILVCWVTAFVTFAEQHTEKITLVNLKLPVYQNDSAVPVIILYAEEAKPIGINFELKGVKLKWLGTAVSDIRGVVTTPAAIYDRSSNMITGNKWIKYRSKEMDLDGIGFDIDQLKQTIHIRSGVKVAIKSKFESNHQKRINNNKSKSSGKIDSAKLLRAIPKLVSFSKNGDSVSNNKKSNSTTKKNVKNTKQDSIGIATYIRIALSLAIALFFMSWFYSQFKRRK